jgi:hypothetical protein
MVRAFTTLLLFTGCGPSDADPEIELSGSDGVVEITWRGRNIENLNFDRDGLSWLTVRPATEELTCANSLRGRQGFTWGEVPDGYETVNFATMVTAEVPAVLDDGSYSVALAECVSSDTGMLSYRQDAFAGWSTSYTVQTLLVQLQAFLFTTGKVEQCVTRFRFSVEQHCHRCLPHAALNIGVERTICCR